jgi:hypothetical protein
MVNNIINDYIFLNRWFPERWTIILICYIKSGQSVCLWHILFIMPCYFEMNLWQVLVHIFKSAWSKMSLSEWMMLSFLVALHNVKFWSSKLFRLVQTKICSLFFLFLVKVPFNLILKSCSLCYRKTFKYYLRRCQ